MSSIRKKRNFRGLQLPTATLDCHAHDEPVPARAAPAGPRRGSQLPFGQGPLQGQDPHGGASTQDAKATLTSRLETLAKDSNPGFDVKNDEFTTLQELGSGNGGSVLKVQHVKTGTVMAKKVVLIDAKPAERKKILLELQIMHDCDSPYIVSSYGAYLAEPNICICMEFMDKGSFDGIYKSIGAIDVNVVGKVAVSVLEGLRYLYDVHRIIHRDIKPSNILCNSQGDIKLCDFGVSGELINSIANTFVGTSIYMSPERIQGAVYSVKSDIWSLGITLLELIVGQFPFSGSFSDTEDDDMDIDRPEPPPPPESNHRDSLQIPMSASRRRRRSKGVSLHGGGMMLSIIELMHQIVNEPSPTLPRGKYGSAAEDFIDACLEKDIESRKTPAQLFRATLAPNNRAAASGTAFSFFSLPFSHAKECDAWHPGLLRPGDHGYEAGARNSMPLFLNALALVVDGFDAKRIRCSGDPGDSGPIGRGRRHRIIHSASSDLNFHLDAMRERIRELEEAIAACIKDYRDTTDSVGSALNPLLRKDVSLDQQADAKSISPPKSDTAELADSFGAMALSDAGTHRYFGPTAGTAALLSAQGTAGGDRGEYTYSFAEVLNAFPLTNLPVPTWNKTASKGILLAQLPDEPRAWALFDIYCAAASWYGQPIMPDELRELVTMVYSPDTNFHELSPHALAIVFLAFASATLADLALPAYSVQADAYFDLGRAAMTLLDVSVSRELYTIQALLMVGLYYGTGSPRYSLDASVTAVSMAACLAQAVTAPLALAFTRTVAPSYDEILELDKRLRHFIEKAPFPHYEMSGGSASYLGYIRAHMIPRLSHNLIIYIHRSSFVKAIKHNPTNPLDSPYAASFLAAYRGANSMIKADMRFLEAYPEYIHRWWPFWKAVTNSAFILASVAAKCPKHLLAPVALADLLTTVELIERASKHCVVVTGALTVLHRLRNKAAVAFAAANDIPVPVLADVDLNDLADDTDFELIGGSRTMVDSATLPKRQIQSTADLSRASSPTEAQMIWEPPISPVTQQRLWDWEWEQALSGTIVDPLRVDGHLASGLYPDSTLGAAETAQEVKLGYAWENLDAYMIALTRQ
ncbi:unnamed protein product [Mycena citricolor]|uniref:Protein kinase domain-containing protein n=1 Tax=Mycena citricolor TaxID=2018698 RepID=A0AAD2K1W6_9AGAR|nr:unnamed protein product [Mycena citricolor]